MTGGGAFCERHRRFAASGWQSARRAGLKWTDSSAKLGVDSQVRRGGRANAAGGESHDGAEISRRRACTTSEVAGIALNSPSFKR
jgi:hypothetical protein